MPLFGLWEEDKEPAQAEVKPPHTRWESMLTSSVPP